LNSTLLRLFGYAATGAAAGLIGGLLGIGGGAVMVPSLNLILDETMHLAIAGSLVAMIFISASSAWGHWKNGYVLKSVVVRMVPLATVSAVAGVIAGAHFPGAVLRKVFALFLLYSIGNMLYKSVKAFLSPEAEEAPLTEYQPPNEWVTPMVAVPMGFSCGVLGIGGGVIAVPALHLFLRLPLKNAIANSAATIFFSATVAAVAKSISINGMTVTRTTGDVLTLSWHHAVIIGVMMAPTAFIAGRLGSHLTHVSPTGIIRVVFAAVALWASYKFWTKPEGAPEADENPAVSAPEHAAAGLRPAPDGPGYGARRAGGLPGSPKFFQ